MFHFSGFARKMKHLSSFSASEASAAKNLRKMNRFSLDFEIVLSQ
ncbi:MAG: hypothetical protein U5L45_10160 [Saprospiraceae bacterium]|nr:hypothetical protein [Saprospiraceae bacterium]